MEDAARPASKVCSGLSPGLERVGAAVESLQAWSGRRLGTVARESGVVGCEHRVLEELGWWRLAACRSGAAADVEERKKRLAGCMRCDPERVHKDNAWGVPLGGLLAPQWECHAEVGRRLRDKGVVQSTERPKPCVLRDPSSMILINLSHQH